jgi:hypothetical protein
MAWWTGKIVSLASKLALVLIARPPIIVQRSGPPSVRLSTAAPGYWRCTAETPVALLIVCMHRVAAAVVFHIAAKALSLFSVPAALLPILPADRASAAAVAPAITCVVLALIDTSTLLTAAVARRCTRASGVGRASRTALPLTVPGGCRL